MSELIDASQGRLFTDILREAQRGKFLERLTHVFAQVVRSVYSTGNQGKFTVEFAVKPLGPETTQVSLQMKIKAALAEPDLPAAIFFIDAHGNMTRNDPAQSALDFGTVDRSTGEIVPPAGEVS